ncbi:AraC family transcriptional regulator [Streptomyces sp. 8K308]|uniref:AraC family transcriptional regulator n=1 Tax=Streptomyces sp. 8K308 TaxID=2530388 RepID=UPI001043C972|nr:AraC family transcriptional regulator [Streptomyces sp. 8K308]TDC28033.1 AraC family transcriptional regulator [Streptomyces sp. 8K308]
MDPFDELLRGIRADGTAFRRADLSPPEAVRATDGAPLTLYAPLRGEAWVSPGAGEEPGPVRVGDALLVRGAAPFTLSGPPGSTEPVALLVAAYHVRGRVAKRLLDVLRPVLVVPGGDGCAELVGALDTQLAACPPGRQVVLDRLLDWLLVCTLRAWFDGPGALPPGWVRAMGDEAIGPALRAMHAAPERPWTLAALAREAGVSRTTLASRFTRLVGEPPLTYLTDWRMTLAADLLTESAATVGAVARQVGYADAFGFSAAFKRVHGVSPSEYRACHEPEGGRLCTEWAPA